MTRKGYDMPLLDEHGQVMIPIKFMLPEEQDRWARAKRICEEVAHPGWLEGLAHEDRCIVMDVINLAVGYEDD